MNSYDWRNKNNSLWQTRRFYLSSFVRQKITLDPSVYEFIDYVISQGYAPDGSVDLNEIDKTLTQKYQEYMEHRI